MTEAATRQPREAEQQGHLTTEGARNPFLALRQEIERLMDDFARRPWYRAGARRIFDLPAAWRADAMSTGHLPEADLSETDSEFRITVELPGMDPSDIDVKISGDLLTIKGEKKEQKEEKQKDYYLSERRFGSFQRSFALAPSVDREKIDARFEKGVLTIVLPKRADARAEARKIAIKAA